LKSFAELYEKYRPVIFTISTGVPAVMEYLEYIAEGHRVFRPWKKSIRSYLNMAFKKRRRRVNLVLAATGEKLPDIVFDKVPAQN